MPTAFARPTPAPRPSRHGAPLPRAGERRRERRLCRRLAHGLTPAQAARAEGAPEAEVLALLADPDFAELVEAYRQIRAEPEAESRRQLLLLARELLTEAVIDGDTRAACFILREESRGRDPAATLADGVIKAARRPVDSPAPTQAPPPAQEPAPPRTPADPVDRAAWRVAADLRDAVLAEHAVLQGATTAPATIKPTQPVPPPSPPARPAPNRHERRRLAVLRRGRDKHTGNRGPPR